MALHARRGDKLDAQVPDRERIGLPDDEAMAEQTITMIDCVRRDALLRRQAASQAPTPMLPPRVLIASDDVSFGIAVAQRLMARGVVVERGGESESNVTWQNVRTLVPCASLPPILVCIRFLY